MKVSNTGPLIVLYETSLLPVLRKMYGEVLVPLTVYNEISRVEEGVKLFDVVCFFQFSLKMVVGKTVNENGTKDIAPKNGAKIFDWSDKY